MKKYIKAHPWKIIEDKFDPSLHQITESLMSLGNGRMGQRANFAETYTGETLKGNYIGGIYYPDKTRVGWWKNGYPEYFAKVLNSVDWIQLQISIDGEEIDLGKADIKEYHRELDMQTGLLSRSVVIETSNGKHVDIKTERFYSMADKDLCFLRYQLKSNQDASITIESSLDFNIRNADANYDEDFWYNRTQSTLDGVICVAAQTKKTDFFVAAANAEMLQIGRNIQTPSSNNISKGIVSNQYHFEIKKHEQITLTKNACICSSYYYPVNEVIDKATSKIKSFTSKNFDEFKQKQIEAWKKLWSACDVKIEGDISAQQGIRFNIFQLFQTYTGEDPRLNIGPKGFTGEKYGGCTYWDTEAYCLPFYMSTRDESVAKNLLLYRYHHLEKAIENAAKLGFKSGAALYPMVTINGEECHNEWEITFEEIHRNGAIAYAIYHYTKYTGDKSYIADYGLEVLIAIARFWSQRVHKSPRTGKYVMLGVTGPNEYENNVDNNWYTNYIAKWCLTYTLDCINEVKKEDHSSWDRIAEKTNWEDREIVKWQEIISDMTLPYDDVLDVFVQHDGYLDNEDLTVADLLEADRPLNQNWSWDRILRSPFIKQADVLQGMYFFSDNFTLEQLRSNFLYYEPKTVHESSLSPCVHGILAARLGMKDKAYEMYLRTARLDLDDYNNDTEDGCHITSMAGTWVTIVQGFAGMQIKKGQISLAPFIPEQWTSYAFKVNFRKSVLEISVTADSISLKNESSNSVDVLLYNRLLTLPGNEQIEVLQPR